MMVLKNHHPTDATIRAARPSELASFLTHESGFTSFMRLYQDLGILHSRILSSAASRKLRDFFNYTS